MKSIDLEPWKARKIREHPLPTLRYLGHLLARMDAVGMKVDDPLYLVARRTNDDSHHLCVTLHYFSCEGGVWKPRHE